MSYQSINFTDKFEKFSEHWSPRVIAEMNDYQFKLVEPRGVINTGDADSALTADNDVWV